MRNLFNPDNPVMVFFGKVADLLIANVLWLVYSIPVITIGASTTALYYVCLKIVSGEDVAVVRTFIKVVKNNFKQATVIWILVLSILALLFVDIVLATRLSLSGLTNGLVLWSLFAIFAVIFFSMFVYVFALQAFFDNTVKTTLKNAFLFGISYYGHTMIMVVCDIFLFLLGIRFFPLVLPVLPITVNAIVIRKIFASYISNNQ